MLRKSSNLVLFLIFFPRLSPKAASWKTTGSKESLGMGLWWEFFIFYGAKIKWGAGTYIHTGECAHDSRKVANVLGLEKGRWRSQGSRLRDSHRNYHWEVILSTGAFDQRHWVLDMPPEAKFGVTWHKGIPSFAKKRQNLLSVRVHGCKQKHLTLAD